CGIGMVIVLPESEIISAQTLLKSLDIESWNIGKITKSSAASAPLVRME
ncbi:MAG TPA: phosphoribosylformylglycinamidine cyclo-ligase, partial [Gammaproteobacteria bacterium]|nr:phosphoribosylformylglycinamidine cyclo-ligase [Gammaproteobacteria bacterium]